MQPDIGSFIFPQKTDEWPHEMIYLDPAIFSKKKWQNPGEAILHVFNHHHWGNLQYRITDIDYDESTIHFQQRDPQINDIYFSTWEGRPATYLSERSKFFVDNVFEELDVEGEWYFDKHEATLYYKPYDTIDLKTAVIEVPALKELVSMKGAGICFNDGWHGGHVVEFNDIHHTVRETGDHGPFNSWGRETFWCDKQSHGQRVSHPAGDVLGDAKHTSLIRNNRFTDNSGWGIDLDDGSSNYHVYNNLCIGVSIKLREGDYRTVENNIFYKGANPPSYHRGYEDNHDIFRKNIVIVDTLRYNPTEDSNFFARVARENVFHFIAPPEQSKWIAVLDSNIYFSSTGKFLTRVNPAGRNIGFDGEYIEFDEWVNMGFDQNSIIEDPLFKDPEKGDFRLDVNSSAFDIGFKEFVLDRFGLTPHFNNIWIKE